MSNSEINRHPDYQLIDGFRVAGCFSPDVFRRALTFEAQPGDVFLVTYPQNGATFMHQLLFLLYHNGEPPQDFKDLAKFAPHLEFTGSGPIEANHSRVFKVHLPYQLVPKSAQAKYIVICRNPKDCLISHFRQTKTLVYDFLEGSFDHFFELFLSGQVDYGDYFDHLISWYEQREDKNVLLVLYEDLMKDLRSEVIRIAQFLGREFDNVLSDPKIMQKVLRLAHARGNKGEFEKVQEYLSPEVDLGSSPLSDGTRHVLEYMRVKKAEKLSGLDEELQKGDVGSWRDILSPEQNQKLDEKISQRLGGTEVLKKWNDCCCLQLEGEVIYI